MQSPTVAGLIIFLDFLLELAGAWLLIIRLNHPWWGLLWLILAQYSMGVRLRRVWTDKPQIALLPIFPPKDN